MEDNNPTIWEEAYWNTANALHLPVNPSANGGTSHMLQMDGINTAPSTAATTTNNNNDGNSNRSNGSIDSGRSNTANEMYLLYTAPGYRG